MNRKLSRTLAVATITLALAGLGSAAGAATAARTGPSAKETTFTGRLYGVAATSINDAWAVGLNPAGSLILHWNGSTWSKSLNSTGYLLNVAAKSASNAWAVGGTAWFGGKTLIEHWNGTAWTRVPSPSPGSSAQVEGVTVSSRWNAWAAGEVGSTPGSGSANGVKTLIEHWNGVRWRRVPSPAPAPDSELTGITVVSPNDIWAVGWTGVARGYTRSKSAALIEHWNGTAWTVVPSPSPAGVQTYLQSVAATSPRNAWAVGTTGYPGPIEAYILHWDGTTWTPVHAPTPAPGGSLQSVAALSAGDVWASGIAGDISCSSKCTTLIEHWDGQNWTIVPSPNPPSTYLNDVWGIVARSKDYAWAVGTTDYASTMILRWDGTSWKL
jgi:hypothetical protein